MKYILRYVKWTGINYKLAIILLSTIGIAFYVIVGHVMIVIIPQLIGKLSKAYPSPECGELIFLIDRLFSGALVLILVLWTVVLVWGFVDVQICREYNRLDARD